MFMDTLNMSFEINGSSKGLVTEEAFEGVSYIVLFEMVFEV